jgi:YVTN family beta-propeller protein
MNGDMVILDSSTHKEIGKIDFGFASNPTHVIPSFDYKRLYVSIRGYDEVWVIDVGSRKVTKKIKVGVHPDALKITPDERYLIVANNQHDKATFIDLEMLKVVASPRIGDGASGIAVTPDNKFVYISSIYNSNISVIDIEKMKRVSVIKLLGANAITSPQGSTLAYLASHGDSITVVDTTTKKIVKKLYVGFSPNHIVFSKDGAYAFVSNGITNIITVVNLEKFTEIKDIDVASEPGISILSPDGRFVFVACYGARHGSGSISVIDVETLEEVERIKSIRYPRAVAVLPVR